MSRKVPIKVFVGHSDNDKVIRDGHRAEPLRNEAERLLRDDLMLNAAIVPIDETMGDLTDKVLANIRQSDYYLLLLTRASVGQPWVNFEVGAGSFALGRDSKNGVAEDPRKRFFVLVPKIGEQRPQFIQGLVRMQWDTVAVGPLKPHESSSGKGLRGYSSGKRLRLSWRTGVRTESVRLRIGQKLLADVFRGDMVLESEGALNQDEYELWLNAFARWSRGAFLAISRQPLAYWWRGEGIVYRENLDALRMRSRRIQRLTVWDHLRDAFPTAAACRAIDDTLVSNSVKRQSAHTYCCDEAKILDMLIGFLHDCHYPKKSAAYAFRQSVETRLPRDWQETLIYRSKHVFKAKGVRVKRVTYQLCTDDDPTANELEDLFDRAQAGTLRVGSVCLPGGPKVRGAGRLVDLIEDIREHHDQHCSSHSKYRLPMVVAKDWYRLRQR